MYVPFVNVRIELYFKKISEVLEIRNFAAKSINVLIQTEKNYDTIHKVEECIKKKQ